MHRDGMKKLLDGYVDEGLITFTPLREFEIAYDPSLWIRLLKQFEANQGSMDDRNILLYECIFSHDNSEQMSEEEVTLFLLACAFGHQSVEERLLAYIERYVINEFEDGLISDEMKSRGYDHEEPEGFRHGE